MFLGKSLTHTQLKRLLKRDGESRKKLLSLSFGVVGQISVHEEAPVHIDNLTRNEICLG